jgi:Brp/Blh family beta-carotene 15,15'-monooxygenase
MALPLDDPDTTYLCAALMMLGGLPHGAFDMALASRAFRLGRRASLIVLAGYLSVAATMALLWAVAPVAALVLFLVISAFHFGEDWTMIAPRLLRAMAGLSIIAAPAIGQPHAVASLFTLMAGESGALIARLAITLAPVSLLVTAVGLAIAWREGFYRWAAAQATALVGLMVLPPAAGFTLYFVMLHSPRHLGRLHDMLHGWQPLRIAGYGAAITAVTIGGAALLGAGFWTGDPARFAAECFRTLAVVAAPHLLLSVAIDRHLSRQC